MDEFRYLNGVSTIRLDEAACVGCGMCETVCPHGVMQMNQKKVRLSDPDGCMECGACATNCPTSAITVTPGVGCALYIIQTWIRGRKNASCGSGACC